MRSLRHPQGAAAEAAAQRATTQSESTRCAIPKVAAATFSPTYKSWIEEAKQDQTSHIFQTDNIVTAKELQYHSSGIIILA